MSKRLVVIHGATGIGKTATAIKVAQALGCEILSADSRQFYKEMTIGTAVPSPEELSQAKHHFIHSHSVESPINAGVFETEAIALLDKIFKINDYAVLVGGSGLYINALLYGMDDIPSDESVRCELSNKSIAELGEMLKELDYEHYQFVDKSNRNRLIRAVEVCLVTGKKYSELRTGEPKKRNFEFIQFALDRPREELYDRINRRVDIMIEQGLENEARKVEPFKNCTALQTVGYREFFDFFDGKTTFEEAVELIKRNSRRYAKRQYTWIKAQQNINWINAEEVEKITEWSQK